MELNFTRLDDAATIPTRAHDGDAGLDLYALEHVRIGPEERIAVRTGVAVEIPEGHAGLVLPRSGLARRHGISPANPPRPADPASGPDREGPGTDSAPPAAPQRAPGGLVAAGPGLARGQPPRGRPRRPTPEPRSSPRPRLLHRGSALWLSLMNSAPFQYP